MKIFTVSVIHEDEYGNEQTVPFAYAMKKEKAKQIVEEQMAKYLTNMIRDNIIHNKMKRWHNKNKFDILPFPYNSLNDKERNIFNASDSILSASDLKKKKEYHKQHNEIISKNFKLSNEYSRKRKEFYDSICAELDKTNILTAKNISNILKNKTNCNLLNNARNNYVISEVEVLE